MSHATIYRIMPGGTIRHHEDVRNAMAGALLIWSTMAKDKGLTCGLFSGFDPLWSLFSTDRLTRTEKLVLGFTFDSAWVRAEKVGELATALRAWWGAHLGGGWDPHPTIPGLADALDRLPKRSMGACFAQTSVTGSLWYTRSKNGKSRAFRFGRDTTMGIDDREPMELFAEIGE